MIIHVKTLPSNFKPYPFKDFKINAISLRQAVNLGDASSLSDLRSLIGKGPSNRHPLSHAT